MGSRLVATGRALPRTAVTNNDLARVMDTSDEWIRTRTGIERRYVMASGESLVDIAPAASQTALERAGIRPADLDAIIVGTVSSEYGFPSFACQLQHRLGVDSIPAYDVAAACSGFIYALSVADNAMRAGDYSRVLLVGTDALSTMVDWNDRAVSGLFGDGAGAAGMGSEAGRARESPAFLGRVLAPALGARDGSARDARLRDAALARRRDQDEGAGAVQARGALDGRRHAQGGRACRRAPGGHRA